MTRLLSIASVLVAVVACSAPEADLDSANEFGGGGESPPTAFEDGDAARGFFRIDVHPPVESNLDSGGLPLLLPQTFEVLPDDEGEAVIRMSRAVDVTGEVSGYGVSPYSGGPDLPGTATTIEGAEVELSLDGTVQQRYGFTDEAGAFRMRAAPNIGYRLRIVPDSGEVPFASDLLSVLDTTAYDVDLGYGVAVWGTVTTGGQPLVGARIHAELPDGTAGADVVTDGQGRYMLRVLPDRDYRVVSEGRDNGDLDPTVTTDFFYVDALGAKRDIAYAPLSTVGVSGVVRGPTGNVGNATVKLTSVALDGYTDDAELAVTYRTNDSGVYSALVVPGVYEVEILPPASSLTPASLGEVDASVGIGLPDTVLPGLVSVSGTVWDNNGWPVAGALVQAAETGFGKRSWTTTSDADGGWTLDVPQTGIEYTVSPPADRGDLALTVAAPVAGAQGATDLVMAAGLTLSGRVIDEDDDPVEYATIEVRDQSGRLWAIAFTGSSGRFETQVAVNR